MGMVSSRRAIEASEVGPWKIAAHNLRCGIGSIEPPRTRTALRRFWRRALLRELRRACRDLPPCFHAREGLRNAL